jgi:lysophospholipase L1-like esterase
MKEHPLATLGGLVLAALLSALQPATQASQGASGGRWVTAWSSSQQTLNNRPVANTTVRMIARVALAGEAVRLRLDNGFGTSPLTIGRTFVGARARGALLVGGSNRQVLFGGSPSVTIPTGGTVESDPVTLNVAARQDLAVSFYVPDSDVRPSAHLLALTTSYVGANGAGDATADESATPFKETTASMLWLKAIDVRTSPPARAVVAFGDSITDGSCAPVDGRGTWVDWLATRFNLEKGRDVAVLNEGIGGNTVTRYGEIGSPPGVERLDRDVLSHHGVTHVILFMGTNDIRRNAPAATVVSGMEDIVRRVKARGLKIYGATIIPRHVAAAGAGNPGWTAENSMVRREVNRWIRTKAPFDAVIDFDEAVRDLANADRIQSRFNCDDIHPSPLGYYELAKAIKLNLF